MSSLRESWIDRADRDSDRADRDSDRADRDIGYAATLKKWSTISVVALCVTLTLMWSAIVWNQQLIIRRQMDHDRMLKGRTTRFERLEQSEAEQRAMLERIMADLNAKQK